MKARDIMTRLVCTVEPATPVARVATLLLEHGISAVPVVDSERRVVGIVSEGDLIHRPESGTGIARSRWLALLADPHALAREYAKTHGAQAADVMTRDVLSVDEDTSVAEIAAIFDKQRVKRVPVLADGRLVGIVSRADLIRAVARGAVKPAAGVEASDQSIRSEILARLKREPWIAATDISVVVKDGVVDLSGLAGSVDQRHAARILAEGVAGVRIVHDRLGAKPAVLY
jgi:CBS-domain-containing membrane protein